jgi:glutamate-1-semialdehyde 2,1-aminomutase
VRAYRAVGGVPVFVDRGQGPFVFDADGRRWCDWVQSYGALIAGHAAPSVVAAVKNRKKIKKNIKIKLENNK